MVFSDLHVYYPISNKSRLMLEDLHADFTIITMLIFNCQNYTVVLLYFAQIFTVRPIGFSKSRESVYFLLV